MIDQEVFVEVRENSYGYSPDYEWAEGVVVAEFTGGDLLVQYGDDKRERYALDKVAFKQLDKVIDLATTDSVSEA